MIEDRAAGEILARMVQISRTFRVAGQRSREQSLNGTRFGFLQQLSQADARLGELARRLSVSAPVASRTVDSLETEGLVERHADPSDARAFLVSITGRGRALLGESENHAVRRFATALADWSPQDAEQAIGLLTRLNFHLGEVLRDPDAAPDASGLDTTETERGSNG
ncbi:MarR family winged helix-turn-helix transcriptional regulator [Paeniglutamicibacter cryotolerans]|uniref:DNA-binding MarR family transcriptional regulator n=1 Tax=Paeniglutamicibacter cryotolerans TaxID=670079 RepID=A0A839QFG5_9MICC|nr:MarR family transcriptional regulator [Paeniglutamicibacter cryotolerans]MBB2994397.1 DNA-binding MarR family transcriptional regulator [Paeniglutamicibacter cryotolerans]